MNDMTLIRQASGRTTHYINGQWARNGRPNLCRPQSLRWLGLRGDRGRRPGGSPGRRRRRRSRLPRLGRHDPPPASDAVPQGRRHRGAPRPGVRHHHGAGDRRRGGIQRLPDPLVHRHAAPGRGLGLPAGGRRAAERRARPFRHGGEEAAGRRRRLLPLERLLQPGLAHRGAANGVRQHRGAEALGVRADLRRPAIGRGAGRGGFPAGSDERSHPQRRASTRR